MWRRCGLEYPTGYTFTSSPGFTMMLGSRASLTRRIGADRTNETIYH